jgi:hypothetical protein
MEMFLMAAALSLLGVTVSTVLFAAATRGVEPTPVPKPAARVAPAATQFFAAAAPSVERLPIEALLLQIERHIRLEQAAAESFHFAPTAESLHSRTASPLVH